MVPGDVTGTRPFYKRGLASILDKIWKCIGILGREGGYGADASLRCQILCLPYKGALKFSPGLLSRPAHSSMLLTPACVTNFLMIVNQSFWKLIHWRSLERTACIDTWMTSTMQFSSSIVTAASFATTSMDIYVALIPALSVWRVPPHSCAHSLIGLALKLWTCAPLPLTNV